MTRARALVVLAVVAAVASIAAPDALSATTHLFTATYTGTGTGAVSGTHASGTATAAGRGTPIGHGTLRGSATGVFTTETCVTFNGTALLQGTAGSIKVVVRGARACVAADANDVAFSGSAKVTRGTETFAGARGTLSLQGKYSRESGAVTISFKGRITY